MRRAAVVLAVGLTVLAASPAASASRARRHPTPCVPTRTPVAEPTPVVSDDDLQRLRERALLFPVPEVTPGTVRDTFHDRRGGGPHEALDIAAPRGALAVAVDDGTIEKLFRSVPGGLTVYVFDADRRYAYYYAHLDRYLPGLAEGQRVRRGDVLGYVGSTGNAAEDAPHLHFAIFKLEPGARWWRGTPLDPYPVLVRGLASPARPR